MLLLGMCSGLEPSFNVWTAIAPFASTLLGDEKTSTFDTVISEGTNILKTVVALPGRVDRVITQMERGEFSVRTPRLDCRVRGVERAVRRQSGAIVFAALLIAGAIMRASDYVLSNIIPSGAGLTLVWLILSGRGGHPGV